MNIVVRQQREGDYRILLGFLMAREFPPLSREILGPFGFVAEVDGEVAAGCWVYRCVEKNTCYLAFLTTKPGLGTRGASVLDQLVRGAVEELRRQGYRLVFVNGSGSMARYFENTGWVIGDRDNTHFFLPLT